MRLSIAAAVAATLAKTISGEKVIISYQTELSAVAHRIAVDKGYYSELGLEAEMKWYPSGAPQVKAAVEEDAWDFGGAGVVPNIIGGPQGIIGVGISMDQSATNQLMGNAAGNALWPPDSMEGIPIALSPNSTGDYVVQACLTSQGFNIEDVEFIYAQQSGVIDAMTPDGEGNAQANLGGLWAPNTYVMLNDINGSKALCSGASVYTTVTGGHMARREWAEANPDLVAKVLAGWLRAVHFINLDTNKEEVLDYMSAFFQEHDIVIPKTSLELDLRLVGLFGLTQQLELMERRGEPPLSNYDIWTNEVGNFMLENGVIAKLTDPTTYIHDTYMKRVSENPELRAWALGQAATETDEASGAWADCHWMLAVASSCLLLLIAGFQ